MSSCQKNLKKDFSLGQYYSQLQKYESNMSINKSKFTKKDSGYSSFAKQISKPNYPSKKYRDNVNFEDFKLRINDQKDTHKANIVKLELNKDQNIKKSNPNDEKSISNVNYDSICSSNISNKRWRDNQYEKQNNAFSTKDENQFTNHCCQLYNVKPSYQLLEDITQEINKRDEVYILVEKQFGETHPQEKYPEAISSLFKEHALMKEIISHLKSISKLDIDDLNELFYFLKSDC